MDFGLSEEQKILRKSARDFLKKECPKTLVREMIQDEKGYSPQLWGKMAEMEWQGLGFPVEYGGSGGSFLDLVILFEEIGRALLPSPFFATVVLGGMSIMEAGTEKQKQTYLPKVAKGDILLTLAMAEPGARHEADSITLKAAPFKGDYIINGTKLFVPYANTADYILCVANTGDETRAKDNITIFIVNAKDSTIAINPEKVIGQDKQYEVIFKETVVSKQDILGRLDIGWVNIEKVLHKATVALSAEMNGATEHILEMTTSYAKERVQFGKPIGSYQAIQHRCVDTLIALRASQVLTYDAAWKISLGIPCAMDVSMAKAWASESYKRATWTAMEINGGVASIVGHDMPLYYRHAKGTEVKLGDADFHRELIATEVLDKGPEVEA
jgi:alkylation response protein AidB-like acyl-CoA dehydrogenase